MGIFVAAEVRYLQHTAETGQLFAEDAITLPYDLTSCIDPDGSVTINLPLSLTLTKGQGLQSKSV